MRVQRPGPGVQEGQGRVLAPAVPVVGLHVVVDRRAAAHAQGGGLLDGVQGRGLALGRGAGRPDPDREGRAGRLRAHVGRHQRPAQAGHRADPAGRQVAGTRSPPPRRRCRPPWPRTTGARPASRPARESCSCRSRAAPGGGGGCAGLVAPAAPPVLAARGACGGGAAGPGGGGPGGGGPGGGGPGGCGPVERARCVRAWCLLRWCLVRWCLLPWCLRAWRCCRRWCARGCRCWPGWVVRRVAAVRWTEAVPLVPEGRAAAWRVIIWARPVSGAAAARAGRARCTAGRARPPQAAEDGQHPLVPPV